MTSLLDISFLKFFSPIFVLILAYVIVYVVISKIEYFKDQKNLAALVAFIVALFVAFSVDITNIVSDFLPNIFIFILFVFFVLLIASMSGLSSQGDKENKGVFELLTGSKNSVAIIILIIVSIVFLISFSSLYGGDLLSQSQDANSDDFSQNIINIMSNAQILGAVALLLLAVVMIKLLGGKASPE
jgi:hypothetical protein